MNKVIMMGRLTRDPDVRYHQTGDGEQAIAKFSLAVDRPKRRDGQAEADFFNCTSFGKQGEFVEKYLKKGTKVLVTGKLQNDNYTNRDGQKVYAVQIVTESVEFCESKGQQGAVANSATTATGQNTRTNADGFMNIPDSVDDEELPFN